MCLKEACVATGTSCGSSEPRGAASWPMLTYLPWHLAHNLPVAADVRGLLGQRLLCEEGARSRCHGVGVPASSFNRDPHTMRGQWTWTCSMHCRTDAP